MEATMQAKPFTVRLRLDLYDAAARLAKRRSSSLNALIQDTLAAAIRDEEDREMYEAAELLGQFPDECDVEYAFAAQSEVVLRERP